MLFVNRTGEGVNVATRPKRAKVQLDREQLRSLRARTFEVYRAMGVGVTQIAELFGLGQSTVSAELAHLRQQRQGHGGESPPLITGLCD